MVLSIFIVSLFAMSVVSATDNATNDVGALNETTADAISAEEVKEVVSVENNQGILENVSDDVAEDLSTVTVYNEKHKHAAGDPQEELKELTVKDRTFYIGKYKAVISKYEWYGLRMGPIADNEFYSYGTLPDGCDDYYNEGYYGLWYAFVKKTNKVITIKYGKGKSHEVVKIVKKFKTKNQAKQFAKKYNNKFFKYSRWYSCHKENGKYVVKKHMWKFSKVITKKARVFMHFSYGGGQYGNQDYDYTIGLYTKYDNPGFETIYHSKNIKYAKWGNNIRTLNKAKVHRW